MIAVVTLHCVFPPQTAAPFIFLYATYKKARTTHRSSGALHMATLLLPVFQNARHLLQSSMHNFDYDFYL